MVGGTLPQYLDGFSLMPQLNPSHPRSIGVHAGARPDYITMQYHSNMGNTGMPANIVCLYLSLSMVFLSHTQTQCRVLCHSNG